jgi:hypothetical protein
MDKWNAGMTESWNIGERLEKKASGFRIAHYSNIPIFHYYDWLCVLCVFAVKILFWTGMTPTPLFCQASLF